MCNMEPFLHFLCVSVDMKAAWWLLPFYCISPRVIAVSSLLLKPCQSARAKWQPSGNRITGRRGSQESPSSDLLAKWSDCVVMSWALRRPFPWRFLQTHIKKFLQVSDAKSSQLMLGILVSCHHKNNGFLFLEPVEITTVTHNSPEHEIPTTTFCFLKKKMKTVRLETAYSWRNKWKKQYVHVVLKKICKIVKRVLTCHLTAMICLICGCEMLFEITECGTLE